MGFDMKDQGGERIVHREGAGKKESDAGRGHYELVSPLFMRRLAIWLEKGAEKYKSRNWEEGIPQSRIIRALLRHTYQYLEGMRDEDHLAAISCNIMFLIHFEVGIKRGLYSPEDVKVMCDLPDYVTKLKKALDIWCKVEDCKNMQVDDNTPYCDGHVRQQVFSPESKEARLMDASRRYYAAKAKMDAIEKEGTIPIFLGDDTGTSCQFPGCENRIPWDGKHCPVHTV